MTKNKIALAGLAVMDLLSSSSPVFANSEATITQNTDRTLLLALKSKVIPPTLATVLTQFPSEFEKIIDASRDSQFGGDFVGANMLLYATAGIETPQSVIL